jgi:uncharacterized protein (UPF0218 family)
MKKRFEQFNFYISQIKAGKTAIIVSPDYVVIDWKTWRGMQRKEKERQIVFYDEASEITDEVWNILEKRLRKDN